MPHLPQSLLPRSLIGRVFALYSAALLLFVGGGMAVLCHLQYTQELDGAQRHADSIGAIAAPTVSDSAVIGDYDTIQRTLERAIYQTDLDGAAFIDVKGGRITASRKDSPEEKPPAWLARAVSRDLYDMNLPITAGGKDYGILRLSFASERIAATLWRQAIYAMWVTLIALGGGMLLIRIPLVRWLGGMRRLPSLEDAAMVPAAGANLPSDAPTEFRQTYEVLNRAALTLQAEREQAGVTLGAIADAVFTLDAQGRVVYANAAVLRLFGIPPEHFLGIDLRDALPQLFASGDALEPWNGRHAVLQSIDERRVVVDANLSSIVGPDGQAKGHVLACRDVTETDALHAQLSDALQSREVSLTALRRVLEGHTSQLPSLDGAATDDLQAISRLISELVAQLQEHGEQLAAIFELCPDGFVSFDARRCVNYVSPAFTKLTLIQAPQAIGMDEASFNGMLRALCAPSAQGLRSFEAMRQRPAAGAQRELIELRPPLRRVLELGLRQGGTKGVSQVLYLRDVTRETEVDRMKSEFLSTAAHELRTPMASIFGFVELMMNRRIPPQRQQQTMEILHRQTKQMIAIINELLDLSRIEARGGKDLSTEALDLGELLARVIHDFQPPEGREPPLAGALDSGATVLADRGKAIQAVLNVLSNAYKYSPQGGDVSVRLVSRPAAPGEDQPRAGIEVQDNGIGMTAEQLARIGERFYRADASGNIPGTGLGMSIVKEVLELQGGAMELASEFGAGTRVRLWWPVAAVPAAHAPCPGTRVDGPALSTSTMGGP